MSREIGFLFATDERDNRLHVDVNTFCGPCGEGNLIQITPWHDRCIILNRNSARDLITLLKKALDAE
jgi:hypothetical protein